MHYILRMSCLASLTLLALLAGCASPSGAVVSTPGGGEICQVCRYNRDLACVCVKVDESTPRAEYQGTTYYFCSEDCRAAFLKKPQKYVSKR